MRALLLVSVVALAVPCGTAAQDNVVSLDLRIEARLSVGESEELGIEYLFGRPTSTCTGPDDSILVADRVSMNIRQYSRDGELIRVIGSRGHGPGEFSQLLQAYTSDDRTRLFVVDGVNRRISEFDTLTGQFVDSYAFHHYYGNPEVDILPDGRHVMVFSTGRSSDGVIALPSIAILDLNASDDILRERYSIPAPLWDADEVTRHLHGLNPGSLLARKDGTILYAPRLYGGRIFEFEFDAFGSVRLRRVVEGTLRGRRPYEVAPASNARDLGRADVRMRVPSSRAMKYYRLPCQSLGLFESGRLFGHIVYCDINGRREHAIEFFDNSGEPVGVATLDEWAEENDNNTGVMIGEVDSSLSVVGLRWGKSLSPTAFVSQLVPGEKLRLLLDGVR